MNHSSYLNTLTSILANENLKLAFTSRSSAYINLQTRTIFLPEYTINVSGSDIILSERLICHEVAHALYTPYPRNNCDVCIYGLFDSDVLNEEHDSFFRKEYKLCREVILILDDIRIENLFIKKFNGVGNLFAVGWKKYIEIRNNELSLSTTSEKLNFLSRINCYFKSNKSVFFEFTNEEQIFVDRITDLYSIEDLFTLTYMIGNFLLKNKKKCLINLNDITSKDSTPILVKVKIDDNTDDNTVELEKSEIEMEDNEVEQLEQQDDEDDVSGGGSGDIPLEEDYNLSTDEKNELLAELKKNNELFKKEEFENKFQYTIETIEYKKLSIISSKLFWERIEFRLNNPIFPYHVLQEKNHIGLDSNQILCNNVNTIYSEIQKNVNILNIEFHRLKKAKEHRKVTHQPSGTLNLSKLHSYQTSKNLFKTLQKTPKGKNHEFIIYLDWSGSICHELINLVKEVCTIITFCHKNQIKFRVYGFVQNNEFIDTLGLERSTIHDTSSLIEFISSNDDFEKTIKKFLKFSSGYQFYENFGIDLGCTPLFSVLMRSTDLFKQLGNSDKHVNLMIFSDGSSDPYYELASVYRNNTKIFDQVTGKIYHPSDFIKSNDQSNTNFIEFDKEICFNYCFDRLKTFVPNLKITTIHIGYMYGNGFIGKKNKQRKIYNNYIFTKSYHYTNFSIQSSNDEYKSYVSDFLENNTKLTDLKTKDMKQLLNKNFQKMNSSISRVLYKHIAEEIA